MLGRASEELPLLRRIFMERDLQRCREEILSDQKLKSLGVALSLSQDEVILIHCPSSIALSYCRGRERIFREELGPMMKKWNLTELRIILSKHDI